MQYGDERDSWLRWGHTTLVEPGKSPAVGLFRSITVNKGYPPSQKPFYQWAVGQNITHIRFALFLKCPIFPIWFWNGEKLGISKKEQTLYGKKNGHFEKNARDQFWKRKGTENEILRFLGISKKGKSYHMTKSSFTCFFGHFILPPVFWSDCMFWSVKHIQTLGGARDPKLENLLSSWDSIQKQNTKMFHSFFFLENFLLE